MSVSEEVPAVQGGIARRELSRFLRYGGIGAVATVVHYALLVVAVEWGGWPATWASGLGAVVGAQVAYFGNRSFTFGHRGAAALSWPRFQLTALLGAGIGVAIVALAVHWRWHYLVGQVLATGFVLLLTYAINLRWTFAARQDPN